MRKIVSLLSLLLVFVLLAAAAVPAFAENEAPAAAGQGEEADYVRFTSTTDFDPYGTFSFSPDGNNVEIDADVVRYAAIRYRTITEDNEEGIELGAQFYVMTPKEPYVPVIYNHTKQWETVIVDMTSISVTKEGMESVWNYDEYATPSQIRFDPMEPNRENPNFDNDNNRGHVRDHSEIDIAWIAFFEKEEDAKAYTGKENTPYCYIDADCLENYVSAHDMKATRYINDEKAHTDVLDEVVLNPRASSATPIQLNGRELGIHTFAIPEGYAMRDLILASCPIWSNTNGDSDATADAYIWRGDYDSTIEFDPIASVEVLNHQDNAACKFNFGDALRYGAEYLIVIYPSNEGAFGFWTGDALPDDCGWEVYLDEIEEEENIPPISYTLLEVGDLGPIELPTKAPTAEPTKEPDPTEAPTATAAPEATEVPAPTKAPDEGKKDNGSDSDSSPAVLIAVIAVVVAAAATAVIIIIKKKKK